MPKDLLTEEQLTQEQLELREKFLAILGNEELSQKGKIAAARELLKNNPAVTKLDLSNKIAELSKSKESPEQQQEFILHSMQVIADALIGNFTLETLNLANNKINHEGAAAIVEFLPLYRKLQTLDLGNHLESDRNNIGPEGAKAIAGGLMYNEQLRTLNLRGNNIGYEGAQAMAYTLEGDTPLRYLGIHGEGYKDEDLAVIIGALRSNTNVRILDIRDTPDLGPEALKAMEEMAQSNCTLQNVFLHESIRNRPENPLKKFVNDIFIKLQDNRQKRAESTVVSPHAAAAAAEKTPPVELTPEQLQERALQDQLIVITSKCLNHKLGYNSAITEMEEVLEANNDVKKLVFTRDTSETLNNMKYPMRWARSNFEERHVSLIMNALRNNTTIDTLEFSDFGLTEQSFRKIGRVLQNNTALRTLKVEHENIKPDDIEKLMDGLAQNTSMQALDLSHNHLTVNGTTNEGIEKLCKGVNDTSLKYLRLGGWGPNQDGNLAKVIGALKNNTTVKTLDLRRGKQREEDRFGKGSFGPKSCKALRKVLQSNRTLQDVRLDDDAYLDPELGALLAKRAASEEIKLTEQVLAILGKSDNGREVEEVDNKKVEEIGKLLAENSHVTKLDLNNKIFKLSREKGEYFGEQYVFLHRSTQVIARVLGDNTTLHTLILGNNQIDADGAGLEASDVDLIGEALAKNTTLRTLDLGDNSDVDSGGNHIRSEGAKKIMKALRDNTTLRVLSLSANHIGDQGACAIGEALKDSSLTSLDLSSNKITERGMRAILDNRPPSLTVNLKNNLGRPNLIARKDSASTATTDKTPTVAKEGAAASIFSRFATWFSSSRWGPASAERTAAVRSQHPAAAVEESLPPSHRAATGGAPTEETAPPRRHAEAIAQERRGGSGDPHAPTLVQGGLSPISGLLLRPTTAIAQGRRRSDDSAIPLRSHVAAVAEERIGGAGRERGAARPSTRPTETSF